MTHPMEIGLVLEGEDAEEFMQDLRNEIDKQNSFMPSMASKL